MKDLEKIIKDRKEEFNDQEPLPGHMERFQSKLFRNSKKNFEILRIAAIVVAAAFISVATYVFIGISKNDESYSQMPIEVRETIYYYESLTWEKENEIMSMPIDDRNEKNMIQNDLKKFDEQYQQLVNDLKKYPNDQRVINAIIEYHRSKSEMLEHILFQLNKKDV